MAGGWLFDIAEIENFDFLVLSTSNDKVSSGGDGDSVDAAVMNLNAILNVESLVVPDLQVSVPSNRSEVLTSNGCFG